MSVIPWESGDTEQENVCVTLFICNFKGNPRAIGVCFEQDNLPLILVLRRTISLARYTCKFFLCSHFRRCDDKQVVKRSGFKFLPLNRFSQVFLLSYH